MDSKTIHSILDKYWEGETSLEEENTLRTFFNQDDVPPEFADVQPLFRFFKEEQAAYLNGDFEEQLSIKLKVVDNKTPRRHSLTYYIKRVAAVAAIFIAIMIFLNRSSFLDGPDSLAGITTKEKVEAKLAYAEAKAALLLISKKLNKGTDKAESSIIQVQKATNIIKE